MPRRLLSILPVLVIAVQCKSKQPSRVPVTTPEQTENSSVAACSADCESAFGSELGANENVVAYSNCVPECIDPTPHQVESKHTGLASDTYTGITWQCVEYARRWWLMRRGAVFGSVDAADDMWREVSSAQHLASETERAVTRHNNGGPVRPEPGDLIIYRKSEALAFGHVAVVVDVDTTAGFVSVAEQNFANKPWPAPTYARRLPLIESEAMYAVYGDAGERDAGVAEQIYGWLRLADD